MYSFILMLNVKNKPPNAGCLLTPVASNVVDEGNGWFRIEGEGGIEDGWMAIINQDTIADYYKAKQFDWIRERLGKPTFYLVQSRDRKTNFANDFILKLNESTPALVDNDNGYIGDIAALRKMICSGIDWRYCG